MKTQALSRAIVSPAQIAGLSHPLAAANHWQWVQWEGYVLRNPEALVPDSVGAIIDAALAGGLAAVLEDNARSVVAIVRRQVGELAYPPDFERVVDRKKRQFAGWVNYAAGKTAEDRRKWLLQCRTPFLALPPAMQESDYVEARADLDVIAQASGLVLAEDQPEFSPLTPQHLRHLRRLHALGMHGRYRDYGRPWTGTCLGCHASWSITP